MKPTEQDIQAELDRHGLGWKVTESEFMGDGDKAGWVDIKHGDNSTVIHFYGHTEKVCFNNGVTCVEVQYTDFLTGNYDLSAISQHYEPEEWQRIITMCERIVRLITGEQTLEEKVREILEPLGLIVAYVHNDEVSVCNKLHQFWITRTHIRWASEEKTIEEYHDFDGYYRDEFEQVSKHLAKNSTKPSYSDLEQRVDELGKEVSKRNGKVTVLEQQLKASRERVEQLENQNDELIKQNARLIRERDEAESKLQDCPTEKDMEDFEQLYDKEMARKDRMISALRKDKDHLQEKASIYQFAVEQSFKNMMEASQ